MRIDLREDQSSLRRDKRAGYPLDPRFRGDGGIRIADMLSPAQPVRILGIDPGSRLTGYGLVEAKGSDVRFLDCGLIQAGGDDFALRLKRIFDGLGEIIAEHAPEELAIEKVFVHRNVTSALKLGQARGAALLAAATRELKVFEYSPNEIKQAVTGRGHAGKEQIQHMIRVLLKLKEAPATDAADALAVAVCHAHISQTKRRMAGAVAAGAP